MVLIPVQFPMKKSPGENLGIDTPKYIVESDATIVAPLIFAWILGMVKLKL